MEKKWQETFKLWAQNKQYQEKLEGAKCLISKALSEYKCYVAYSGGKDSTVVLHLVLQLNPNVMVLHWDYGRYYMPKEVLEEIIGIARKVGVRNLRIETSDLYKKLGRKAINVLGRELLGKLVPQLYKEGYRCVFLGLRAEESIRRKLRVKNTRILKGIKEICPLHNWTWLDVWAYIVSNNLPYLSHYDKYAQIEGWNKTRFVTYFDPEFNKFGAQNLDGVLMWQYKYLTR